MVIKENYYLDFLKEYHEIKSTYKDKTPSLLLHVCCGACSCYPLVFLADLFDVTIFYSNSNIHPKNEFDKRLEALTNYVNFINEKLNTNIKIIVDDYNHKEFVKDLVPYKDSKEGGDRCKICIEKRFTRAFEYASNNDYDYVTTVMTVSRNKNVNYLNELGKKLEKNYPNLKYVYTDFKKNNGQDIGVLISKEFDVYRQDYCGCEFSIYTSNNIDII